MVKFKGFSRPLSVFQVLFMTDWIFKTSCIFKYFSSLCEPCPIMKSISKSGCIISKWCVIYMTYLITVLGCYGNTFSYCGYVGFAIKHMSLKDFHKVLELLFHPHNECCKNTRNTNYNDLQIKFNKHFTPHRSQWIFHTEYITENPVNTSLIIENNIYYIQSNEIRENIY